MKKLLSLCLIAAFTAFCALNSKAADKDAPAEKGDKKPSRPMVANGKIASVDTAAKSVKVGERTFHVTANTKITKAGKPATLDEAKVGDEVGISYREAEGGKLELVSLRVGPKPEKKPADDKK
jgi:hypothetical protein